MFFPIQHAAQISMQVKQNIVFYRWNGSSFITVVILSFWKNLRRRDRVSIHGLTPKTLEPGTEDFTQTLRQEAGTQLLQAPLYSLHSQKAELGARIRHQTRSFDVGFRCLKYQTKPLLMISTINTNRGKKKDSQLHHQLCRPQGLVTLPPPGFSDEQIPFPIRRSSTGLCCCLGFTAPHPYAVPHPATEADHPCKTQEGKQSEPRGLLPSGVTRGWASFRTSCSHSVNRT